MKIKVEVPSLKIIIKLPHGHTQAVQTKPVEGTTQQSLTNSILSAQAAAAVIAGNTASEGIGNLMKTLRERYFNPSQKEFTSIEETQLFVNGEKLEELEKKFPVLGLTREIVLKGKNKVLSKELIKELRQKLPVEALNNLEKIIKVLHLLPEDNPVYQLAKSVLEASLGESINNLHDLPKLISENPQIFENNQIVEVYTELIKNLKSPSPFLSKLSLQSLANNDYTEHVSSVVALNLALSNAFPQIDKNGRITPGSFFANEKNGFTLIGPVAGSLTASTVRSRQSSRNNKVEESEEGAMLSTEVLPIRFITNAKKTKGKIGELKSISEPAQSDSKLESNPVQVFSEEEMAQSFIKDFETAIRQFQTVSFPATPNQLRESFKEEIELLLSILPPTDTNYRPLIELFKLFVESHHQNSGLTLNTLEKILAPSGDKKLFSTLLFFMTYQGASLKDQIEKHFFVNAFAKKFVEVNYPQTENIALADISFEFTDFFAMRQVAIIWQRSLTKHKNWLPAKELLKKGNFVEAENTLRSILEVNYLSDASTPYDLDYLPLLEDYAKTVTRLKSTPNVDKEAIKNFIVKAFYQNRPTLATPEAETLFTFGEVLLRSGELLAEPNYLKDAANMFEQAYSKSNGENDNRNLLYKIKALLAGSHLSGAERVPKDSFNDYLQAIQYIIFTSSAHNNQGNNSVVLPFHYFSALHDPSKREEFETYLGANSLLVEGQTHPLIQILNIRQTFEEEYAAASSQKSSIENNKQSERRSSSQGFAQRDPYLQTKQLINKFLKTPGIDDHEAVVNPLGQLQILELAEPNSMYKVLYELFNTLVDNSRNSQKKALKLKF